MYIFEMVHIKLDISSSHVYILDYNTYLACQQLVRV